MGFTEKNEESASITLEEVQESMSRLREEMDVVKKVLKRRMRVEEKVGAIEEEIENLKEKVGETETLKEKVGAIEKETETLKEKVGAVEEETKTLKEKVGETETLKEKEKVGAIEKETKTLKEKVGAIEEETKTLKEKVGETETLKEKVATVEEETETLKKKMGAVEEETKTLKEKVGAIEEGTEILKENVGAIKEETITLEGKVGAIKQEGKRVAKKIQDLKVDALTVQYNSFLERKAKFDHEGDEKLRTFFLGFTVDTLILTSCSLIQHSAADLSKFLGCIMTLTVAMSLIFLALSINLLMGIWDFISQAKNLKTEKKGLESDFRAVQETNGDAEAGPLDEHAAKMAQDKAACLKEMPVRVMPLLGVAGVIVVVTVICFVGQLIFVGKFFKLF